MTERNVTATADLTVAEQLLPEGTTVKFLRDVDVSEAFQGMPGALVKIARRVKKTATGNTLAFSAGDVGIIQRVFTKDQRDADNNNPYLVSVQGAPPAFAPIDAIEITTDAATVASARENDHQYKEGFVVGAQIRATRGQNVVDIFEGRVNPLLLAMAVRKDGYDNIWEVGDSVKITGLKPSVTDPKDGKTRGVITIRHTHNGVTEEWPVFEQDFELA